MDVRAGLDHGSAATGHRWVDKRSAVHQQRRGESVGCAIAVHPTTGVMIKAPRGGCPQGDPPLRQPPDGGTAARSALRGLLDSRFAHPHQGFGE